MGELKQPSCVAVIESQTWERDSHDLYDYEAETYHVEVQKLSSSSMILRDNDHIFTHPFMDPRDSLGTSLDHLFTIKVKENSHTSDYEVFPAEKESPYGFNYKKLWRIVSYLPNQKYHILENDIIKLGRCKLTVRQLIYPPSEFFLRDSQPISINYDLFRSINAPLSISEMSNLQCRFCLGDGGTDSDPLITPCFCKGTIAHVHLSCLQKWYEKKQENNVENSSKSFVLKLLRCDMCRHVMPVVIKRNQALIKLFQIPNHILQSPPLIVLENLAGSNPRSYHIISISNQVKLGRGHECDVRIPDVSISRHHASINYDNLSFTIKDEKSKFGTLVALRQSLPVKDSEQLVLQAGRSVLKVQLVNSTDVENSSPSTSNPK